MSPTQAAQTQRMPSFPRVSGDEPRQILADAAEQVFSPRERG